MEPPTTSLDRNSIGLAQVVFQSVATMGPAVGLALSLIVGASFAGGALPLSALVAMFSALVVAVSVGQLAKHLPSAGGLATFASRALHPTVGFVAGWGYSLGVVLATPFILLLIAVLIESVLPTGASSNWWIPAAVVAAAIVLTINYAGVRTSTKAGLILGSVEIVIFVALALTLIGEAGSHNTLRVFGTEHANVPGFEGWGGVFAGSVYVILAFLGFEAAAPMGEEARNPKRAVQLAVVGSCVLVGVFYVFGAYAGTVFFGADQMADFAASNNGSPWTGMAKSVWGGGWWIVFFILLNSGLAVMNGAANAGTRVLFALSRPGVLPGVFRRVHPRYHSPHVAILFNFTVGLGVALGLGVLLGPMKAYAFLGTLAVALILPTYALVNIAAGAFYLRHRRSEFNIFLHLVAPIIGVALLVLPFLANLGIPVASFIAPLPSPYSYVGPIVLSLYAVGIVVAGVLWVVSPDRLQAIGALHVEGDHAGEPVPATAGAVVPG